MGDGTKENPYTREDVLRMIQENRGTAEGLDLSEKAFKTDISLFGLDLSGIILRGAVFSASKKITSLVKELRNQMPHKGFAPLIGTRLGGTILHNADLSHAKLSGIDMSEAQLQGANLDFAELKNTNLIRAQLQGASLQFANLTNAYIWGADLKDAKLNNAQLKGAVLSSARMEGVYLYGADFLNANLRYVNWGNYISGEETAKSFRAAAANYRELKIWYSNKGFYDISGECFYREMEATRKALKCTFKPLHLRPLWLKIFRILCGYGERPFRVFLSALVIIFGLAAAYFLWGSFSSSSFWDTLYYSAASFTALGYGQWAPQPTGWAKAMGAAEAFMGVFMIALFLVTFTRKMTR